VGAGRGGFVTRPALMQLVHTERRRGEPLTMARTLWMFGFQRRFVRMCEWLMLIPKDGFLPQSSHTDATAAGYRTRSRLQNPDLSPPGAAR
jgi:hypothetical protein